MSNQMELSIVLVNWNTANVTVDCIDSVYKETSGVSFEVILVDNASSDRSVDLVRERFPGVRIVENRENCGFAAANNQGIALSTGRFVLLLNSDTIVHGDALKKAVDFANAHPEAGVVGCRLLNPDGSLQRSCFQYPSIPNLILSSLYLNKLFPRSRFFGRERMTWWNHDDVREVETVMGAFMLVRKDALLSVKGMDEEFFMYGEETDWCRRFSEAGWKVFFTPESRITHLGGQSSRQVRVRSIVQLRLGILQYFSKHSGKMAYLFAGFLISLFFFVRIPAWFLLWVVKPKDTNRKNKVVAYVTGWYRVIKATIIPRRDFFKA